MPSKKSAPALPSSPEEVSSPVNGEVESPPAAVKPRKRKAEPAEVTAAAKRKGGAGKLGEGLAAGTIPEDAEAAGRSLTLEVCRWVILSNVLCCRYGD